MAYNPVILTVPDYTNKALPDPNVDGSIADQLIDVIPAAIAAVPDAAAINAEVDTALNTIVPASPTAGSLNDILSKAAGGNTFNKATDSLEALSEAITAIPATDLTVPAANSTDNVDALDVIGNKTDAAQTTVGTTRSIMAYVKGLLNQLATVVGYHTVPAKDATTDAQMRDVIGKKDDTAVTVAGTDKSLMAYIKGLLSSAPIKGSQAYTTGSGNWTCPTGVNFVDVIIVAGGGDGASGNTGGGGGGEVVTLKQYPVTPGSNYAYVVGAGGATSSFDVISASPGVNATGATGGAGGGSFTGAVGGAAATRGQASGGNRIARHGGGGGGNSNEVGGGSYFAAGGAAGASNTSGGGGSWKAGANGQYSGAANSGGGGGAGGGGGTGYILITWGY